MCLSIHIALSSKEIDLSTHIFFIFILLFIFTARRNRNLFHIKEKTTEVGCCNKPTREKVFWSGVQPRSCRCRWCNACMLFQSYADECIHMDTFESFGCIKSTTCTIKYNKLNLNEAYTVATLYHYGNIRHNTVCDGYYDTHYRYTCTIMSNNV